MMYTQNRTLDPSHYVSLGVSVFRAVCCKAQCRLARNSTRKLLNRKKIPDVCSESKKERNVLLYS